MQSKDEPFRSELAWLQHDRLGSLQAAKEEIARQGGDLLDLSMINPDLPPPRVMIDKLVEASLKPFNHRYAVSRGVRKLREAFAGKYRHRFGVTLDTDSEVCVTMGTKDAILDALTSLASPGQTVVLPAPTYPAHLSAVLLAGLKPEFYPLSADHDQMLAHIEGAFRRSRAKILLVNFPNNPTGMVVQSSFYEKLASIVRTFDAYVINDFVYGEMVFDGASASLLSCAALRERGAETYSLSKAYSVPGWRVAALCGEARLIRQVTRLKAHVDYGIFLPIQSAASHALLLKEDLVKPLLSQYNNRCNILAVGLRRLGWKVDAPRAGACVWAEVPEYISGRSMEISERLIRELGVLAMPGELFGAEFCRHVRFAVVLPEERVRTAIDRLSRFEAAARSSQGHSAVA